MEELKPLLDLCQFYLHFYKSIESLLLGDSQGFLTDPVTKAEGWMAKFNQQSSSDKGSESFEILSKCLQWLLKYFHRFMSKELWLVYLNI